MHHSPLIQHIGAIGDIERQFDILLDQQSSGSLRLHGAKQFEHLTDQHRHAGWLNSSSSLNMADPRVLSIKPMMDFKVVVLPAPLRRSSGDSRLCLARTGLGADFLVM